MKDGELERRRAKLPSTNGKLYHQIPCKEGIGFVRHHRIPQYILKNNAPIEYLTFEEHGEKHRRLEEMISKAFPQRFMWIKGKYPDGKPIGQIKIYTWQIRIDLFTTREGFSMRGAW